jgi:hypothetical protein
LHLKSWPRATDFYDLPEYLEIAADRAAARFEETL